MSRPRDSEDVGDLRVDVLAGLGARRQRDDAALGVVLGEHPGRDRAASVADAGEDDLRDVLGHGCAPSVVSGTATRPEADVHQSDEDGNFDEGADDSSERLTAGHAEDADRDGDGELEVVAAR